MSIIILEIIIYTIWLHGHKNELWDFFYYYYLYYYNFSYFTDVTGKSPAFFVWKSVRYCKHMHVYTFNRVNIIFWNWSTPKENYISTSCKNCSVKSFFMVQLLIYSIFLNTTSVWTWPASCQCTQYYWTCILWWRLESFLLKRIINYFFDSLTVDKNQEKMTVIKCQGKRTTVMTDLAVTLI